MKFRRNKIKREHSIIDGALDWLEDLSKKTEVTDIIPGVIDVTNSRERGITYQYETPTGCKLMLKSGGSIQEAFVVTKNPQAVEKWITKIMEELELFRASLNDLDSFSKPSDKDKDITGRPKNKQAKEPAPKGSASKDTASKGNASKGPEQKDLLFTRDELLSGIKENVQIVEINQGLRDSLVESLATMADLEDPKIEDILEPAVRNALGNLQESLDSKQKRPQEHEKPGMEKGNSRIK